MNEAERMRELVAGYRRSIAPQAGDRSRIWERLETEPASATPARDHRSSIGVAVAIAIAVAAAVVLALGLAGQVAQRTAIAPPMQSADSPRPDADQLAARERAAAVPVPATLPPAPSIAPAPARDEPAAATIAPREPAPRVQTPTLDPLRAELPLIEAARAALDRGEHARVLQLLDDHRRRFPAGVLRPEARALRAIALCAAGRTAQGRGEAHVLLGERESSAHHGRVREACGVQ